MGSTMLNLEGFLQLDSINPTQTRKRIKEIGLQRGKGIRKTYLILYVEAYRMLTRCVIPRSSMYHSIDKTADAHT